jgi:hypothetical protein
MTAFFLPSFPSGNYGQYQVGQALHAFSTDARISCTRVQKTLIN